MTKSLNRLSTLACICVLVGACATVDRIVIGKSVVLPSTNLGEDRPLTIHLPDSYETQPDRRYPVLYVLDGETSFRRAVGTMDWLIHGAALDGIPEHIIVAIPNVDGSRGRDFSSQSDPEAVSPFTAFLEAELIPFMDREYRTHPYRILHGHSATGSFALYVMMTRPDLFNAYIVASGSWRGAEGEPGEQIFESFTPRTDRSTFLYSLRGDELPNTVANYDRWIALLESGAPEGLIWQSQVEPSEVHMTTPGVTLHFGLRAVYADAHPNTVTPIGERGVQAVLDYFQGLSEDKYGYAFLPEPPIRRLAYVFSGRSDYDTAIEYTQLLIDAYPGSTDNYRFMALWHEQMGRLEEAMQWLERAMALASQDTYYMQGPLLEAQRERIEAAMAEGGS